jgi:hypothetical protein
MNNDRDPAAKFPTPTREPKPGTFQRPAHGFRTKRAPEAAELKLSGPPLASPTFTGSRSPCRRCLCPGNARSGMPVITETIAVAMATPAAGPSFGVAPSGTCTWMFPFSAIDRLV